MVLPLCFNSRHNPRVPAPFPSPMQLAAHLPPHAAITSYSLFGVPLLVRAGVISQSGLGMLNADGATVRRGGLFSMWGLTKRTCSELAPRLLPCSTARCAVPVLEVEGRTGSVRHAWPPCSTHAVQRTIRVEAGTYAAGTSYSLQAFASNACCGKGPDSPPYLFEAPPLLRWGRMQLPPCSRGSPCCRHPALAGQQALLLTHPPCSPFPLCAFQPATSQPAPALAISFTLTGAGAHQNMLRLGERFGPVGGSVLLHHAPTMSVPPAALPAGAAAQGVQAVLMPATLDYFPPGMTPPFSTKKRQFLRNTLRISHLRPHSENEFSMYCNSGNLTAAAGLSVR